jgi:hypothetical protein
MAEVSGYYPPVGNNRVWTWFAHVIDNLVKQFPRYSIPRIRKAHRTISIY